MSDGKIDIRPADLEIVQKILREHLPKDAKVWVWVFGSRATWTTKDSSDLDLAIDVGRALTLEEIGSLNEAFEESDLPYKVDVVDLTSVNEKFRGIIERGKLLLNYQGFLGARDSSKIAKWETLPLGDLIEPERGISYGIVQPGAPVSDGIPIIRVSDIRNGRIATDSPLKVSPDIEAPYSRTRLKGGELLITLVGTVGETAVVPEALADWNIARAVAMIPVRNNIGAYWIQIALRTPEVRHRIDTRLNTTVQATLNLRDVAQLPIILPPVSERNSIAHVLGTLDDKIELNRRMNETLEAMARALFKSWFVDFEPVRAKSEGRDTGLPPDIAALFPDSFEDSELGDIPKGWEVKSFADTVEVIGGGTPKTTTDEFWNGNVPWFSVVDAPESTDVWVIDTEKRITQRGVDNSSTRILPIGTTIISARGTVGRTALVGVPMAMNQSCYGLRGKIGTQGTFSYFATRKLVSILQQRSHGSVFDTITRDTLESVKVVAPPSQVATRFEEVSAPLMQRILASVIDSKTLDGARDLLLPKLISGEIRVASEAA